MKTTKQKKPGRYRLDWFFQIREKIADLVDRNGVVDVLDALDEEYRKRYGEGIKQEDLKMLEKRREKQEKEREREERRRAREERLKALEK